MENRVIKLALVILCALLCVQVGTFPARADSPSQAQLNVTVSVVAEDKPSDGERKLSTSDKVNLVAKGIVAASNPGGLVPGIAAQVGTEAAVEVAKDGVDKAKSKFWKSTVGTLSQAMLEGAFQMMQWAMSFWMKYDYSRDTGAAVQGVKNVTWLLAMAAFVASLIVAGMRLAASRRSGFGEGMTEIGVTSFRFLFFALVMPVAVPAALVASDKLSLAIMDNFGANFNECVGEKAAEMMTGQDLTGASQCIATSMSLNINPSEVVVGPILLLLVALVGICGSLMQLVALIVRTFMVPIAAGLLPLFAAASFTSTGKSGLNHLNSYLIAGIIFKPVCALLYVVVMWMAKFTGEDGDLMDKAIVAMMFAMVGFTAPSLVRMLAPAAAPAGGASGSAALGAGKAALGAAVGAGAMLATGGAAAVVGAGGAAAGAAGSAARGASTVAGGASTGARAAGGAAGGGGGGVGATMNLGGAGGSTGQQVGASSSPSVTGAAGAPAGTTSGGPVGGHRSAGTSSAAGASTTPAVGPSAGGTIGGPQAGNSAPPSGGSTPSGVGAPSSPAPQSSPASQGREAASGGGSRPMSAPAPHGGSSQPAETREFPPQTPPATGEITPRGRGSWAAPGGNGAGGSVATSVRGASRAVRSGAHVAGGAVASGLRSTGRGLRGAASALGHHALESSARNVGRNVGQVFASGGQAAQQAIESSQAPHYFGEIGR